MFSPRLPASPPSTKLVNFRSAHPPVKRAKQHEMPKASARAATVLRCKNRELTVGVGELEGVKEGGGGLEVGSAGDQLVDQVLDTDKAVLAQSLLDDRVVVQGDPLSGDLGVTSLVDELLDGLEVGLTI